MAAAAVVRTEEQEVPNQRVILNRHVMGFPSEDDMELVAGAAHLAVPPGSAAAVLKNLHISCDFPMSSIFFCVRRIEKFMNGHHHIRLNLMGLPKERTGR